MKTVVASGCRRVALSFLGAAVALLALLAASPADAYTSVTHSQLQAVLDESSGSPGDSYWTFLHPTNQPYPISIYGVVVNNPNDMLDSDCGSASQWQVFIQALPAGTYGGHEVAGGDFGGTALYMVKEFTYGTPAIYDGATWQSEMNRLNYPTGSTPDQSLQVGDVVLVQAEGPGLFYKGKFNINEQHSTSSAKDFSVTILQRGLTTEDMNVPTLSLADLKNADGTFRFDSTRASGCEHYQGSLVHLDHLTLVSDPLGWILDGTVTVKQGDLTFPLKLGLDADLLSYDPLAMQSTEFSLTAILDQESWDLTGGYRLWLTDAANLTVAPEPGTLVLLAVAGLAALLAWWRQKAG
jgi:hypothetical protein